MTDYYELLGVDADAGKDDIRAAYREQLEGADQSARAKLNKAWNVLSDPVQRGRYDEARAEGWLGDAEENEDGVAAPPPPRSRAARSAAGAKSRPPARPPLEPTLVLPEGMRFAEPRARNMALLTDIVVLIVIFIATNFAGVAVIKNQYPTETDNISRYVKIVDKADKAESKANDAQKAADAAIKQEKTSKNPDQAKIEAQQAKADAAAADAKRAKARSDGYQKKVTAEQKKLQGPYLVMIGVIVLLCLAYTVPMSAMTGQTLGKRLQHIRLVRVDGSPAGWGGSFAHFAVPIVIAVGLQGVLGPLAFLLGLGAVLWNLRDRNHQGVHDKMAKTIVVADG